MNRPGNRPDRENNWWNVGSGDRHFEGGRNNIGNRTQVVNRGDINVGNVNINQNFQRNVNWSTNREHWGYNPWWNRPAAHGWYGGCWNHGWNHGYYGGHYHGWGGYRPPGYYWDDDDHIGEAIGWGLLGWGLGALTFSSGYNDYGNPYPVQPVQTISGPPITYSQPITVIAASTAPAEPEQLEVMAEKAATNIETSQAAFHQGNYVAALESANAAVAESPGDGALHEYRALVLFALGKFSEAAGVLNPVLAGGPGWDWTTMVQLYDSQETYTKQLTALEAYATAKPEAADARFLLGYHYMVCGHVAEAAEQFRLASELQPKDTIAAQLYHLCAVTGQGSAVPAEGAEESTAAVEEDAAIPAELNTPAIQPESVPIEKLSGKWVADKGESGVVTLTVKDDGSFAWDFTKGDKSEGFEGEYSMNDDGLLVLDSPDAQMVATVALPDDATLKFLIAGGPPGDPGLEFKKGG